MDRCMNEYMIKWMNTKIDRDLDNTNRWIEGQIDKQVDRCM